MYIHLAGRNEKHWEVKKLHCLLSYYKEKVIFKMIFIWADSFFLTFVICEGTLHMFPSFSISPYLQQVSRSHFPYCCILSKLSPTFFFFFLN